jgi:hypothetical protein
MGCLLNYPFDVGDWRPMVKRGGANVSRQKAHSTAFRTHPFIFAKILKHSASPENPLLQ